MTDSLYRDYILDHYRHPKNFGVPRKADGAYIADNPLCGDRIGMHVKLKTEKGEAILADVTFSGEGCAISIASASLLTDHIKKWKVNDILAYTSDDLLKLLGIPLTPTRVKCALLPLEALQQAIHLAKYKKTE